MRSELASITDRRYAELVAQKFTSPGAVEAKQKELASADAAVVSAEASIEGGKPTFTPVRIGQTSLDSQVQVLEGLKAGNEVVVVYSEKTITASSRIKIVDQLAGSKP